MKKTVISVVIPCLNEKQTIKQAVLEAKQNADKNFPNQYEIIVADNGSTDGTLDILKQLPFVRVIKVPIRGYGAALHWGILKSKSPYVLFADADLSYPFSNLSQFKKTLSSQPDLVLGSRIKGNIAKGAMPFLHRYLGTPVLTFLIRLIYHLPTTDCNSGMRIVKTSFYKQLRMRNSGMEWASELLLKTALKKGKYLEIPIKFVKDKRDRPPHLSTWSDGWRHLKAIILLKPNTLLSSSLLLLAASLLVIPVHFIIASILIVLASLAFFSWLTAKFLSFALDKQQNHVALLLNSNRLVSWVIMTSFILVSVIFTLPDSRTGTKMVLVANLAIIFMWTFLIETIKTHLINSLPEIN